MVNISNERWLVGLWDGVTFTQLRILDLFLVFNKRYVSSGNLLHINSLLLKMTIEIVDFPIDSMVDLSIVMLVYSGFSH